MTAGGTGPPGPADERRHTPPAGVPGWSELFGWELAPVPGQPAVSVRVVVHRTRAWYIAGVVGGEPDLTVVVELDAPPPSAPTSLELRASGLWADHNVETPFAHVSLGLEAFGVALDHPGDALRGGFGIRTPVGFDLEWEDGCGPVAGLQAGAGYEAAGRAHGEILLGAAAYEVDGPGTRRHAWGDLDWWGPGWWRASLRLDDGNHLVAYGQGDPTRNHEVARGGAPPNGLARTVPVGAAGAPGMGADGTGTVGATLVLDGDGDGLPAGGVLRFAVDGGEVELALEAVGCVPARLPAPTPGDRDAVLTGLAVTARAAGGTLAGAGWIETVRPLS